MPVVAMPRCHYRWHHWPHMSFPEGEFDALQPHIALPQGEFHAFPAAAVGVALASQQGSTCPGASGRTGMSRPSEGRWGSAPC